MATRVMHVYTAVFQATAGIESCALSIIKVLLSAPIQLQAAGRACLEQALIETSLELVSPFR